MLLIDRQIVRNEWRRRIVEAVNRQARSTDDFFYSGGLRGAQDIVGDGDVEIKTFGVAGWIAKLPALRFDVKTGLGVRETLPRQMHDAIRVFEIILQPMRFAEIGGIGRTNTFSRLDRVEHRNLMRVAKKFAHDELAQPPRSSCYDNPHLF